MTTIAKLKYFFRFIFLQIFLSSFTIFYFDKFLIGNYTDGFNIIVRNLLEDRDRFYPFVTNNFIKIDIFLITFVFLFLIALYASKFYSIVNELSFTVDKGLFDEFVPIFLLWSASLLSFLQIFRFTAVSRGYLLLLTIIIPLFLVLFRNSEFISRLLGRNVTEENYISFNLEEDSVFNELRLLKFRSRLENYKSENIEDFKLIEKRIEETNKKEKINLVVLNLNEVENLDETFEKYLLNLNKKVLLITSKNLSFNLKFYFRTTNLNNKYLYYINNDVQYGSRYILKRVIDLTVSILCLLIFSPILIFTYLFILLMDGRPILYKQTRVGLHGNNFQMFKFRTMKKNSHEQRDELEEVNKKSGPLFKIENDPRLIHGIGFIRKFSIDEIPQFFNVLKGEMSVVGPRPLFPEDNKYFDQHYIRRLNVLPGITGLLQINERNTDDFDVWYKYDIEYIDNWSIYLDFKIMFNTPTAIFRNKTKGY
jgi:lipopolysaccharide/colanic/teichoic acid biosynthesis glycosyltransferase|tara:strand:+ start:112 stop:1551 length:1440 start_codon:yes stop_codon:yes gene_type:complete